MGEPSGFRSNQRPVRAGQQTRKFKQGVKAKSKTVTQFISEKVAMDLSVEYGVMEWTVVKVKCGMALATATVPWAKTMWCWSVLDEECWKRIHMRRSRGNRLNDGIWT